MRFSLPAGGGKAPAAALPTRRPREALGGAAGLWPSVAVEGMIPEKSPKITTFMGFFMGFSMTLIFEKGF